MSFPALELRAFMWRHYRVGGDPQFYYRSGDDRWTTWRVVDWYLKDTKTGALYTYETHGEMIDDLDWWYSQTFHATRSVEGVL